LSAKNAAGSVAATTLAQPAAGVRDGVGAPVPVGVPEPEPVGVALAAAFAAPVLESESVGVADATAPAEKTPLSAPVHISFSFYLLSFFIPFFNFP